MTFEEFLDAELPGLTRYATVLTGDADRGHDVLADAMVKAHSRWRRIQAMDHPRAYVRRILTSTYVSERRRWSTRHIRPTRTGELPDRPTPDPATAVDDRQQVTALLASLPRRQRAAVVLRYYLGLDNAAVAIELGITAGAARTAISRGLAAMRIVAEHDAAEDDAAPYDAAPAPTPSLQEDS